MALLIPVILDSVAYEGGLRDIEGPLLLLEADKKRLTISP